MIRIISFDLLFFKFKLKVKILLSFKKTRRPHKTLFKVFFSILKFGWGLLGIKITIVMTYLFII